MTVDITTVELRKLIAAEGMVLTDIKTETIRSKEIYLGCNDNPDNYKEIDENTPLPEDLEESVIDEYENL